MNTVEKPANVDVTLKKSNDFTVSLAFSPLNSMLELILFATIVLALSCQQNSSINLKVSNLRNSSIDDFTLVQQFDLSSEVSYSAEKSKAMFTGLALGIPLKAVEGESVLITMNIGDQLSLMNSSYAMSIFGNQKISTSMSLVLPSILSDGLSLTSLEDVLVKFTSSTTGQSRYLSRKDFSVLDSGVVINLREWGVIALERVSAYISMSITSPTSASYINAGNVSRFAVAGTCAVEGSIISFSVSTGSSGTKTALPDSNSATCTNSLWSADLDFSSVSEGALTLYADNLADTGQKSLQQSITLTKDTSLPSTVLTTTSNSTTNVSPVPMTATFSESVSEFSLSDLTLVNATAANLAGSGSTYTFNLYPIVNGAVSATVTASAVADGAGNNSMASNTLGVTFNSAAPIATITSTSSSSTATSPIPVTVTFSAAVSEFVATDVTIGNASISNFAGSGTTYTFDVTPAAQGTVTVDVTSGVAIDSAGSISLAAAQLVRTFDTVSPTVAISSSVSASVTNETTIPVTITFNEAVTNFVVGDVSLTNALASNFAGSATTYTLDVTPSGNGAVTVNVAGGVAQDGAGNTNTAASQLSKTYDGTAPTVSVTTPSSGGYINNANVSSITISGSCSENTRAVSVAITDGSITVNPSSAVTCSTPSNPHWTTTVNASTINSGSVSITATHVDEAGNSTTSSNIVVTKDITAPNAAASLGWSQSSPTTATSLTAAWTVSNSGDLASQAIQFYSDATCTTTSGSSTNINSNSIATASYTAGGEGYYSYKITSFDSAGNSTVSACSSSITVATTAVVANSTITGTSPVTADGTATSTVTITLKNANNNAIVGVIPTFSATNTGTTNSYATCSATDGSGASTCTMTSTKAEVKTLSIATPISKADGSVTFQNGPAASIVFTSQPPDGYASVALSTQPVISILDANGNTVTTGADATDTITMTLQYGTGSLGGNVSMAAVAGIANFSGKGLNLSDAGAKTLRATKSSTTGSGGVGALTADSTSFNITLLAPVISTQSDQNFPSNYINQGATFTKDFDNTNTSSDSGMTYACTFDQVIDGVVATGTNCSSLVGTASFNTATGALSWTPDYSVFGPFEFKVIGTNVSGSGSRIFVIDVRPAYATSNLIGNWDAQFADLTGPVSDSVLTWNDLSGNGYDGTMSSSAHVTWVGAGTYSSPHSLSFNGSGRIDFGSTVGNNSTKMMFSSWVNPSNVSSSSDSVILGNSGNAAGNGFTVRQKPSYRDVVMSLNPVGYWRLGETSGTTATDIGSSGSHGTYVSGPTLAQSGALTSDSDTAASFGSNYVNIAGTSSLKQTSALTISAWVYPTATSSWNKALIFPYGASNWTAPYFSYQLGADGGKPHVGFNVNADYTRGSLTSSTSYSLNAWTHVVGTFNNGIIKLYVNGVLDSTKDVTAYGTSILYTSRTNVSIGCDADYFVSECWSGKIDEPSVFSSVLSAAQVATLYRAGTTGKKMDFVLGKSYQDVVMAKNPIAYWRLGESSGTVAADISGYGNNASYKNAPTMGSSGAMTADSDKAVTLNGSSQYIAIPAFTNPTTLSDYTVSIWFNLTAHNAVGRSYLLDLRGDGSASASSLGVIIDNNGGTELHCFAHYTDNNYTEYKFPLTSYTLGTWGHVICSRSGSQISAYFNGAPVTTSGLHSGSIASRSEVHSLTNKARIGTYSAATATGNYWFSGKIDEVTIFSSSLTSAEVATMYNAGIGTYGATCTSTSGFSSSTWNFISGLIDGSSASFFVNGRQECTVNSVPQTLSSASTNLTVGSTASGTKGWVGYLADLLLYGTSDGSAVATAANIKTNFDATADRYRQNPVGNIVKEGLVLNLDAANAKQGLRPFANGCASTNLSWFDLSSSALNGTLTNFASCGASSGWNGDGTSSNPYRLTFDGSSDVVNFGDVELVTGNTLSICSWIKSSSIAQYSGIVAKTYDVWQYHFGGDYNPGTNKIQFNVASIGCVAKSNSALNDNAWHHVCGVYDGGLASANIKLYVDGAVQTATANCTGNVPNTIEALKIGAQGSTTATNYFFAGSIGQASVYNTALTSSQISQNCNALRSRFSGANCN